MKIQSTTKEREDGFSKPCIPEDYYPATLKEVKAIKDGTYGARAVFVYTLEHEGNKIDLGMICYINHPASKDNKLGQTVMAHGVELNDSEIELDALVGTKVKVLVENYDDDGVKVSGINKVKPLE